jgi:hypothetical protein
LKLSRFPTVWFGAIFGTKPCFFWASRCYAKIRRRTGSTRARTCAHTRRFVKATTHIRRACRMSWFRARSSSCIHSSNKYSLFTATGRHAKCEGSFARMHESANTSPQSTVPQSLMCRWLMQKCGICIVKCTCTPKSSVFAPVFAESLD